MINIHSIDSYLGDHLSRVSQNMAFGIPVITFFYIVTAIMLVPMAAHAAPAQISALSPLEQLQQGVAVADIRCNDERILLKSPGGTIACVYPDTAERLALRGWDVLPQSEPMTSVPEFEAALNASERSPSLSISDHIPANENQTSVYEPLYYVAGNKITLSGVEKRIANPSGVWFPVTTEEAINTVMPRLASGIGDKLILPAVDKTGALYVTYDTEMGNKFRTATNPEYPDVVKWIEYRIYEKVTYEERDEFLTSFMEDAGFPITGLNTGSTGTYVYGGWFYMGVDSFVDYDFIKPYLQLNFRGWLVDDLEKGILLPQSQIEKLAFDFAMRHVDLFDEEKCLFEPADEGEVSGRGIRAGVPFFTVDVGDCQYVPALEKGLHGGGMTQFVAIEGTAGEIAWFTPIAELDKDWLERIDIPESAKVRNGEKHD